MVVAILVSMASLVLGAAIGLTPKAKTWTRPMHTFAIVTTVALVVGRMLPDAVALGGLGVLGVAAVSMLLPAFVERLGDLRLIERGLVNPRIGLEVGFLGLLLHKFGDGLGLAASHITTTRWARSLGRSSGSGGTYGANHCRGFNGVQNPTRDAFCHAAAGRPSDCVFGRHHYSRDGSSKHPFGFGALGCRRRCRHAASRGRPSPRSQPPSCQPRCVHHGHHHHESNGAKDKTWLRRSTDIAAVLIGGGIL